YGRRREKGRPDTPRSKSSVLISERVQSRSLNGSANRQALQPPVGCAWMARIRVANSPATNQRSTRSGTVRTDLGVSTTGLLVGHHRPLAPARGVPRVP